MFLAWMHCNKNKYQRVQDFYKEHVSENLRHGFFQCKEDYIFFGKIYEKEFLEKLNLDKDIGNQK